MIQRILSGLVVVLAVCAGPGCIVVTDDGGGGHKHRDNDGGGAAAQSSDGGSDDVGQSASGSSSDDSGPREKRYFVGGYQEKYSHLPDMGETKKYFRAHGNLSAWDRGYFNGELRCNGIGLIKNGAGIGETVIDGDVEIEGDNWRYTGMTFTGNVKIRGNNNDISECEVFGRVDVRGMGNKTP